MTRLALVLIALSQITTTSAGPGHPTVAAGAVVYGPVSSITCPGGAVQVSGGSTTLQTAVTANVGATTFCLTAVTHTWTSSVVPKSGNTFTCAFGAVLDGATWVTADPLQAAFQSHNQNIDDVTIQNCVIRNMPQRGIHAYKNLSDRWTITHVEIDTCFTGLEVPNSAVVSYSHIHHCVGNPTDPTPANRGGAYGGAAALNVTFEYNEMDHNGPETKLVEGSGHIFRFNYIHDTPVGIWLDGDNTNVLIEDNVLDDISEQAIFYEISQLGTIRRNTIRRADQAIFISTSKNVEAYSNILEDNWRGIQFFLQCVAVGGGAIGWDLTNNSVHDNTIRVGTRSGSFANMFSYAGSCTAPFLVPYENNAKLNSFTHNAYTVPAGTTGSAWWIWAEATKTFTQWQAIPQDATGTVQ